jgi:hypothetical protein
LGGEGKAQAHKTSAEALNKNVKLKLGVEKVLEILGFFQTENNHYPV